MIMTVNKVMEQLQVMIDNGIITGFEPFGAYQYSCEEGRFFDEVCCIDTEYSEDYNNNIVCIY